MPQKLINGILIEGDPLASHPGALVSGSLLRGPGVGIKLHDYLGIVLSHGWYKLSPLPSSNFLLKLSILFVPQLDSPLLEERPTFNGLKSSLVFLTPEPMSIKLHIYLWGRTGTLSNDIFLRPLGWKFFRSHFLWGYICKVSLHAIPIITIKSKQTKMVHASLLYFWWKAFYEIYPHIYTHTLFFKSIFFMLHIHIYAHLFWKAFSCYISTHIYTFFERNFHDFMKYIHIYIHTHFFLKAFFYTHTHTHTHTHILKGIFMLYIHIYIRLERHFHATYPHIFVRHLPCCSKFKC